MAAEARRRVLVRRTGIPIYDQQSSVARPLGHLDDLDASQARCDTLLKDDEGAELSRETRYDKIVQALGGAGNSSLPRRDRPRPEVVFPRRA